MPTLFFIEERSIRSPLEYPACFLCGSHYPHVVSSRFCSIFRRIYWAELVTPNEQAGGPSFLSLAASVCCDTGRDHNKYFGCERQNGQDHMCMGWVRRRRSKIGNFGQEILKNKFSREEQVIRPCNRACYWFAASRLDLGSTVLHWTCSLSPCCEEQQRLNGFALVSAPP